MSLSPSLSPQHPLFLLCAALGLVIWALGGLRLPQGAFGVSGGCRIKEIPVPKGLRVLVVGRFPGAVPIGAGFPFPLSISSRLGAGSSIPWLGVTCSG